MQNYPNPFNPETWIPYHLAEAGAVSLSIYDTAGTLIRTLPLGYQSAGFYENRTHAAYWDGRNALGEPVASGVYFYRLTTPSFQQTRADAYFEVIWVRLGNRTSRGLII